jgi:septum formation protein
LARRLASEKAAAVLKNIPENEDWIILAADTVVAQGRRILPKAETEETAKACLQLLSGRAHRVYSGVCLLYKGKSMLRVADTRVVMKKLSDEEIKTYLDSMEWQGKAGGYAIQGQADAFVKSLNGSYSNVVGLPLYETSSLLTGIGFKGGQNANND